MFLYRTERYSNRVLDQELFLFLLDLEIKRARRYQNFISLISIRINNNVKMERTVDIKNQQKNLCEFLTLEIRESDIIASLGDDQLVILLPYADTKTCKKAKARFEEAIKYLDFKKSGIEISMDQFCFPVNGADSMDLINRFLGFKF